MNIGFIGAGHVGTAFGAYVLSKGIPLAGYYSRTIQSSEKAAKLTGSRCFTDAGALCEAADMLFITTTDSQIRPVCDSLVKNKQLHKGQVVVHMSGALASDVLDPAAEAGCSTFSLHPIQSFADQGKALADLPHTYFSLEGHTEALPVLEALLSQLGNPYFLLKKEQKNLYHAATCIFSNYLDTLIHQGLDFFDAVGIDRASGLKAVLPLIQGTLDNIALLGTEKALTGPIARGDATTVANHLSTINTYIPEKIDFYRLMGSLTLELAKKEKLDAPDRVLSLARLFNE